MNYRRASGWNGASFAFLSFLPLVKRRKNARFLFLCNFLTDCVWVCLWRVIGAEISSHLFSKSFLTFFYAWNQCMKMDWIQCLLIIQMCRWESRVVVTLGRFVERPSSKWVLSPHDPSEIRYCGDAQSRKLHVLWLIRQQHQSPLISRNPHQSHSRHYKESVNLNTILDSLFILIWMRLSAWSIQGPWLSTSH